jgi:hypothetical protein
VEDFDALADAQKGQVRGLSVLVGASVGFFRGLI